jgi:NitT/TauT family transport system ATP-binding protein
MEKINLSSVSKSFFDPVKCTKIDAVEDISFSVGSNEIMVLIGPSGCGKTTILNLIAGFIKPTSGKLLFNGNTIKEPGPERTIIFQEYALFPWYTVRKNIEFGLTAKKINTAESRRISDEFLQLINMEKFSGMFPHQLSGGMKQRVALARALAVEPDVLLMDEPFGALDEQTRSRMQQSLIEIWKVKKTTIVFVTHNIDEALILGHKIVVLNGHPARICGSFDINRPLPRDIITDRYFLDIKLKIRMLLRNEVDTAG